ncbi:hypothetical protein BU24DRAFT_73302 [Aaosphaeria arxii CBS 175.79]|uniref:Uncharacterized protein n=1 Tax=Aaosphaeria arxii CBS 175.79 TaxID=1450172 RepID=A0A6A5XBR5_9PLEO|nr:uncharacterized protein BU24DRAFT_73302 [Aaosphaeria arxii CBS 175.79]KAF2010224.1 hypothetical protein BU24DRAFT_73302 [Aaosphaeria arxii CBS 175.79]
MVDSPDRKETTIVGFACLGQPCQNLALATQRTTDWIAYILLLLLNGTRMFIGIVVTERTWTSRDTQSGDLSANVKPSLILQAPSLTVHQRLYCTMLPSMNP